MRIIPIEEGNGNATHLATLSRWTSQGSLLSGGIFETTIEEVTEQPDYFGPDPTERVRNLPGTGTVQGVNEGLTYMEEGGSATFIIPSYLAFGTQGSAFFLVPPNRIVIYDVAIRRIRR